jgi:hypothetical protein
MKSKGKILFVIDYYLPGYKSGGGMRTIVNIVERLGDKYEFFILTRDHDGKLDKTPYNTVKINEWNKIGKAQVFYFSADNLKLRVFKRIIKEVEPQVIYLNSFSRLRQFLFCY